MGLLDHIHSGPWWTYEVQALLLTEMLTFINLLNPKCLGTCVFLNTILKQLTPYIG